MATTINAALKNNIIAQSALNQFVSMLAPLSAFSTSFNDDAAQKGTTISIPTLATTADATTFAGTYTDQATEYGVTQIALDQHLFTTWTLTDVDVSESSAVELERLGYQKGGDIAKAVFQNILAEVTTANYAAESIIAAADFDGDDVADLREDMTGENIDPGQCSIVMGNSYWTGLLKDTNINGAINYGSADIIRDGRVPSLFGVGSLYESTAIPANGENLVGFIAHPSAMAVAMRYLQPNNSKEYISAKRLTDPTTGMVMGYREFYTPSTGEQTAVLECVFGKQVALSGSLRRMISA